MSELFTFRLGTSRDLPSCVNLLRPGDPTRHCPHRLLPLWRRCLGRGAFIVIDELGPDGRHVPQGFGLSVFVRDAFTDSFFTRPRPHMAVEFYDALANGEDVMLTEREVARANGANGINVLVLHFGSRYTDFSKPETVAFHRLIGPSCVAAHGGHRLRTLLAEVYGPGSLEEATVRDPFRLLADFAQEKPHLYKDVPVDERPYLVGLRADWTDGVGWFPYADLFMPPKPVIYFRGAERRLLEHALQNEPDGAIADALGVSVDTIKKTWRSVFEHVAAALPSLLPAGPETEAVRGSEKRRHLLHYLRTHLEELRPYPRPERRGTVRSMPRLGRSTRVSDADVLVTARPPRHVDS